MVEEEGKFNLVNIEKKINSCTFFFFRIIFDRAWTSIDNLRSKLDSSCNDNDEFIEEIKQGW